MIRRLAVTAALVGGLLTGCEKANDPPTLPAGRGGDALVPKDNVKRKADVPPSSTTRPR